VVDARKLRVGRDGLKSVFAGAQRIVVCKGKRVTEFDMRKAPPGLDELAAVALGPTGNLRAPTARIGSTYIVGFGADTWREILGK
jgi:hypothetical protein